MSDDKEIDELVAFGLSNVKGPTLIAPPRPEPYHTCRGCCYFSKSMACSGGLRGAPTYFKSCVHPDVEGVGGNDHRSLDSGFRGSSGSSRDGTPNWCPVLIAAKEHHDD